MDVSSSLDEVVIVLVAVLVTCVVVIVVGRVVRGVVDARRRRQEAHLRPQLVALLADDEATVRLSVHRGEVDTLADLATGYLRKVKGDAHERLVAELERRGVLAELHRRLRSRSAVRRARAAALAGAAGDRTALDGLVARLGDRDPDVRATAVRALGRVGGGEVVGPLLGMLGDRPGARDAVPPGTVVSAVLELGPEAIEPLRAAVRATAWTRRTMAVEALGLLGAVAATDDLVRLVDPATATDTEVGIRAARALGRIGSPRAVPALTAVLASDAPWPLRAVAARALGDIGANDAAAALLDAVRAAEPTVAVNAAHALALLPGGTERLQVLAESLTHDAGRPVDEAPQAAVAAAEALAHAGVGR